MIAQRGDGVTLQLGIQEQVQITPRYRRLFFSPLQHPTAGVDNGLFMADVAVQPFLMGLLDTELADVTGTGIVGHVDALHFRSLMRPT
jgi:hypothetical protein